MDVNLTDFDFGYKGLESAVFLLIFICILCLCCIACIYFISVSLLAFQATVFIKLELS